MSMQLFKSLLKNFSFKTLSVALLLLVGGVATQAQTVVTVGAIGVAGSYTTGSVTVTGLVTEGSMNSSAFVNGANFPVVSWATFNLASLGIPAGANISTVTLTIDRNINTLLPGTPTGWNVYGVPTNLTTAAAGGAGLSLYTAITNTASNPLVSNTSWGTTPTGFTVVNLPFTTAGLTYIANNLTSSISLGFVEGGGGEYGIKGEATGLAPSLSITYTNPIPCTGPPVAGTINATATTSCTPYISGLSLVGATVGTGIVYQWQSSSDNATWVPVSGANAASYSAAVTGPIYYRCLIACTLTTPNPDTAFTPGVFLAYSAPNPLPWSEGFEGLTANNTLPPCWAASNLGVGANGTSNEYTNIVPLTGPSLTAHTGNAFGSFGSGLTSGFFYTPGFQLSSDSTYQFSFWYVGDGGSTPTNGGKYSANITYGNTQTATAQSTVFGTLPSFYNTTYQKDSFVFTPATSGEYFIGIDAMDNGSTTSNAFYWGFDDVSLVTLPACTGQPAAGVLSPTSVTLTPCTGNVTTFTLTGFTVASNISFQWQQSTDGGNTFTPIPGATSPIYIATITAPVTKIFCIITCGATGQTAPSATATVNYTAQLYSGTPFIEGFENTWLSKCNTKDAPSTYWYDSTLTSDNSWRRNDDVTSAVWSSTATGAYAPTGSTLNGATGTHSARFHTSAFTTNGVTGVLSMYLNLSGPGPKRLTYDYINASGTDSIQVLLSTNGTAGPFTKIDHILTSAAWVTKVDTINTTSANCIISFKGVTDAGGSSDIGLDNVSVIALDTPTLTVSVPSLSGFNADNCSFSGIQSFTISAQNLSPASGAVIITAPPGFVVSATNLGNNSYGATATTLYSNSTIAGTTIYVKFEPTTAGPASGNIVFTGGGLLIPPPPTVAVSGVANGLRIDSAVLNFGNATQGIPSAAIVDTLRGYNLSSPDVVTVSTSTNHDFQVSSDSVTWGATCTIPISGPSLLAPIYTRLVPGALGAELPDTTSFAYSGTACTPTYTATGTSTPACTTPAAPANISFSGYSTTGVTVAVIPSDIPTGYLLIQSLTPFTGSATNGINYTVGATIANGTVVANGATGPFTFTGLIANTTYYFTLIEYNGGPTGACGGGPLYGPQLSAPATTCIGSPALTAGTGVSVNGFTINWTAPAINGGALTLYYKVEVSANTTFTLPVAGSPFIVQAPTTTLAVTGLTASSTYTYRVTDSTFNPGACINSPTAPASQATPACTANTWLGGTSTDWSNGLNWSCGVVPPTGATATIPSGTTNAPSLNTAGTTTITKLIVNAGATFTIASGATLALSSGTPMVDNGTITGAGIVSFTATSTLTGNGTISNLTCPHNLTLTSGNTLNLTGTFTMAGNFTFVTNGGLTLISTAAGTARIASLTGTGNITGTVKVQQYIPGSRRGFRFFGHPFTAGIALSQLATSIDITGAGGSANGFTPTITNNPSAFWFNPATGDNSTTGTNPGWTAFANTSSTTGVNAWLNNEGIRLLVRGASGQGLDGNAYTPNPATLNMTGTLKVGAVTQTMLLSGSGFNLFSNPYPSPTDIGTVINTASVANHISGSGFWVWDENQQLQGAYVTQPIGGAYVLPMNSAYVVKTSLNNSTLVYAETNKSATVNPSLFKTASLTNGVVLHLYDTGMRSWDRAYISFNNSASDSMENYDASHLSNTNLDFYSLSSNGQMLSIDARPYVTGQVVPLGITTDVPQTYIIKAENFNLPANEELYLHDKYLNQYQELQDGSQYTFSITSDPASQGNNRFELSMAATATTGVNNVNGSNGLKVNMVPNPATGQVTITYEAPRSEKTSVRIMNMAGQEIINMDLGDEQKGSVVIPLHNVAAGMYMVELISGSEIVTQRLVKQ